MPSRPEDPLALISEDDRTMAVQRLQDAFAHGYISHDELDERLQQILTAKTRSELAPGLVQLPQKNAGATSTIAAKGRIRRRGAWRVPQTLKVESEYGKVHLDLARAIIEYPVVNIELRLPYKGAKIIVPRDAIVDVEDLHTEWKDKPYETSRRARPGGPEIRISGTMGYGRLKIRHARR